MFVNLSFSYTSQLSRVIHTKQKRDWRQSTSFSKKTALHSFFSLCWNMFWIHCRTRNWEYVINIGLNASWIQMLKFDRTGHRIGLRERGRDVSDKFNFNWIAAGKQWTRGNKSKKFQTNSISVSALSPHSPSSSLSPWSESSSKYGKKYTNNAENSEKNGAEAVEGLEEQCMQS